LQKPQRMKKLPLLLVTSIFALGGCVSKGRYDEAVAVTQTTRAELEKNNRQLALTSTQLQQSNAELESRKTEIENLRTEIERLVQIDRSHTGEQMTRISELRKRLAELEAAQRAAEHRAHIYEELTLKLKKQIDTGDLEVIVRNGRMVLLLPNDVLFDTGRTELKPAGKDALEAVATVIASMPQRHFQISGHTDNVPIHNAQFASNWELSAGRALRVVHFLIGGGVKEANLSAAGYSDTDPIVSNLTTDGRRKNRRTEITLQPNIDELVQVPE
jgi:chemotaxis protein MotB